MNALVIWPGTRHDGKTFGLPQGWIPEVYFWPGVSLPVLRFAAGSREYWIIASRSIDPSLVLDRLIDLDPVVARRIRADL